MLIPPNLNKTVATLVMAGIGIVLYFMFGIDPSTISGLY